jgi:hypothetical protein
MKRVNLSRREKDVMRDMERKPQPEKNIDKRILHKLRGTSLIKSVAGSHWELTEAGRSCL